MEMNMIEKIVEKSIGDMYLAAAFLSYGVPLVRIDRDNPRRQRFIFSGCLKKIFVLEDGSIRAIETPDFEELEICFTSKTLAFLPSYPDAIRAIKSSLHAGDV